MSVYVFQFISYFAVFHIFIMLNREVCMFELLECLTEDWRKPNVSPSFKIAYFLTARHLQP